MSRESLYNLDCTIRSKSSITDDYGQYIYSYAFKSTERCAFITLTGGEIIALGLPSSTLSIRVYLNNDVDIVENDEIILEGNIYEVIWINELGHVTGLTEGIQVDCKWISFCVGD